MGRMGMTGFSAGHSYRIRLDAKRRPTLPHAVLLEAGVDASRELVARADGKGRLVLEDPAVLLSEFQARVARGRAEKGSTGSLADELIAERAAEAQRDL